MYDWAAMRRQGYRWWIERFRRTFGLFDLARIDHFRGFVVVLGRAGRTVEPAGGPLASRAGGGPLPGGERSSGRLPLIAEDLGMITPAVDRLRSELGLLGMRIVGRGFVRRHRGRHAVAVAPRGRRRLHGHARPSDDRRVARRGRRTQDLALVDADLAAAGIEETDPDWALVRLALSSRARIAILPMQDVLGLGDEARMNHPGTVGNGNWRWRLEPGQASPEAARAAAPRRRAESGRVASATGGPRGVRMSAARLRVRPRLVTARERGYVGILSVELHFPEAGSLKGKRAHVKSAKAQLQNRFGASVAEVDHHDLWQRCRLTMACCSRGVAELHELLDAAERWLHGQDWVVAASQRRIVSLED